MPAFIAVFAIIIIIAILIIIEQRKLVILDENIINSMNQIGVQLSGRFDDLLSLLNLAKCYDGYESEKIIEMVKSRRSVITAKSTPDDVIDQEEVISEALCRIAMITRQYPELKDNEIFIKTLDAVKIYEGMVRTSRLIYNDSVTRLNREIRIFPCSWIAGILGFHRREYLAEREGKACIPIDK